MIESMGDIELTNEYWDCECDKEYIHIRLQEYCPVCKTESKDQPDSRVPEVIKYGFVMFGEESAQIKAKKLALAWIRGSSIDEWPEYEKISLSDTFDLNIYIDDDENKRATVFLVDDGEKDLESSIEVL